MPHLEKAKIASLHFYPIKSCAGIDLEFAEIGERGIKDDRTWLITDTNNCFLTQRDLPRMCLIKARIVNHYAESGADNGCRSLELNAPGMPPLTVPELYGSDVRQEHRVKVWRDECTAIDQGAEARDWLEQFLGHPVKLMKISQDADRKVKPINEDFRQSQFAFQDGYPFLIISDASLADLNSRLEENLPMNRFRPNIVVSGVQPFDEDNWKLIRINGVQFQVDKPCGRCVITTIEQTSAQASKEPLKTLATFRKQGKEVMFGQNAIHLNLGTIGVGDEVEILLAGKQGTG